jgi:hypothetical protein
MSKRTHFFIKNTVMCSLIPSPYSLNHLCLICRYNNSWKDTTNILIYFGILGTMLSSLGVSQIWGSIMSPSSTLKKMEPVRCTHPSNYIWSQNIPPKPLYKFTRLHYLHLFMYLFIDDSCCSVVG